VTGPRKVVPWPSRGRPGEGEELRAGAGVLTQDTGRLDVTVVARSLLALLTSATD
jgi:hypothetical protein